MMDGDRTTIFGNTDPSRRRWLYDTMREKVVRRGAWRGVIIVVSVWRARGPVDGATGNLDAIVLPSSDVKAFFCLSESSKVQASVSPHFHYAFYAKKGVSYSILPHVSSDNSNIPILCVTQLCFAVRNFVLAMVGIGFVVALSSLQRNSRKVRLIELTNLCIPAGQDPPFISLCASLSKRSPQPLENTSLTGKG